MSESDMQHTPDFDLLSEEVPAEGFELMQHIGRDYDFWRMVDALDLDPENLPAEVIEFYTPELPYERYEAMREAGDYVDFWNLLGKVEDAPPNSE